MFKQSIDLSFFFQRTEHLRNMISPYVNQRIEKVKSSNNFDPNSKKDVSVKRK